MEYKISDFCKRQELPELSAIGIYKIQDEKGRTYIGSTTSNFRDRWHKHKNQLKKLNHHSNYLQNVYNKHGANFFSFSILEVVENKDIILSREQFWIDTLKPEFNILLVAGNSLGYKFPEDLLIKIRHLRQTKRDTGKGVNFDKASSKWRASIYVDGKNRRLGLFNSRDEALEVRLEAEKKYWLNKEDYKQKPNTNRRKSGSDIKQTKGGRWVTRINCSLGRINLGTFDTYEEALQTRLEAEKKYWT